MSDAFNDLKKVHPFLLKKWNKAFSVFFDINRNNSLEWEDFEDLLKIIGKSRGEDSATYHEAVEAMKKIWHSLVSEADMDSDNSVSLEEWQYMWLKMTKGNKKQHEWQKLYMDFTFKLLDASKYIGVMRIYGVERKEAEESFDKFAKNSDGQNVFAIDYETYCKLFAQFFESQDPTAPGNFIFGDIDA